MPTTRQPQQTAVALAQLVEQRLGLSVAAQHDRLEHYLAEQTEAEKLLLVDRLARLPESDPLWRDLIERLLIHESFFYRHPAQLDVLARQILPGLSRRQASRADPLRVWCAGCAMGEEAYTLAFLLRDAGCRAIVTGTDLSPASIDQARLGRYQARPGLNSFRSMPGAGWRHFVTDPTGQDTWSIAPEIKRQVTFTVHNLMTDPAPDFTADIISCRNTMIYFGAAGQRRAEMTLLRAWSDIDIVGDFETLAEALKQRGAHGIIIDREACAASPLDLADMGLRYPGRVILVGEGLTVSLPVGLRAEWVTPVPGGSAAARLDLSVLSGRLKTALDSQRAAPLRASAPADRLANDAVEDAPNPMRPSRRPAMIAITTSTGGPEALKDLLGALDPPPCPIIIALHIPRAHTDGMAKYLATVTTHAVTVGQSGPVDSNAIILLPGGADFAVTRAQGAFRLQCVHGHDSSFHPNGTVLLSSIAGLNCPAVGIVLTGMGDDGCRGAQALRAAGHPVLAQDPATCAVAGMPRAAIAAGGVSEVASLLTIAMRLNGWFALPL